MSARDTLAAKLSDLLMEERNMAEPNYADLIRTGLKLLFEANKAILRAALPLDRLQGLGFPPTAAQALVPHSFTIDDNSFKGRMTKEQWKYLDKHMGSLKECGHAVAKLLSAVHVQASQALKDLSTNRHWRRHDPNENKGNIPVPTETCCYVGGMGYSGYTESECTTLHGRFDNNACVQKET